MFSHITWAIANVFKIISHILQYYTFLYFTNEDLGHRSMYRIPVHLFYASFETKVRQALGVWVLYKISDPSITQGFYLFADYIKWPIKYGTNMVGTIYLHF